MASASRASSRSSAAVRLKRKKSPALPRGRRREKEKERSGTAGKAPFAERLGRGRAGREKREGEEAVALSRLPHNLLRGLARVERRKTATGGPADVSKSGAQA